MNKICSGKLGFKKVTHVIFDLDGLLLDTEHLYTKAAQNVLNQFNKTFEPELKLKVSGKLGADVAKEVVQNLKLPLSWQEYYSLVKQQYPIVFGDIALRYGKIYTPEIRAKVIGTVETESARIAVTEMQLPLSPQEFLHEFKSTAEKSLASVGILPGAERLVRHFHANRIPMAVATSSGEDSYSLKVAKHKSLFALMNHVVTGGSDPEVKKGKPAPDIFLVCAARFKDSPKPEKCLVFEDAPNGVQAATEAGMQTVMVPDSQIDENLCKLATLKLNSLKELKPELFGLPQFK